MRTKVLGWGVSVTAVAVLGFAGIAEASVFSEGGILGEFGSLRFTNITPGKIPNFIFVDSSNFNTGGAPPGSLAREFLAPFANTGAFAGYNNNELPTPALIRSFSFDPLTDVSGFTPGANGNTFVELPPSSFLPEGALLNIDLPSLQFIGAPGSFAPITSPVLNSGEYIFRANGQIKDVATGETAKIQYDFTVGAASVDFNNPTQTLIGTFSGTKIVVSSVPEPASIVGLLVSGGLVTACAMKKRKNSNLN